MQPDFEQLFRDTGAAHHQAFIETDGADPEWPLWYARYIVPRIRHLFTDLTESEVVYYLVLWDRTHQAESADQPWTEYYAQQLRALANS